MIGLAFGYLIFEARNHHAARAAAIGRGFVVGILGLLHSFSVTVLALAFAGELLIKDFVLSSNPVDALRLILNGAGGGLLLGVLGQTLWDDRSITYPLRHFSASR